MLTNDNQTSLSIKYIPLYSRDVNKEMKFFIQYFNLIYAGKIKLNEDSEGVLLKLDLNKDVYILLIPSESVTKGITDYKIIINTADCLRDYVFMKSEGIEFDERPQYLPLGLSASFKLSDGSQYMLLEERNYNADLSKRSQVPTE